MKSRNLTTTGIRMRWEEAGKGPPVIFIHGIPTSPCLWYDVINELKGIRALAWEMVGYGSSIPEGAGRDLSVAQQSEYLVQWMDAMKLEDAVLVGHDLGGGVAQITAVHHPKRVRGLVLANSISYDSWPIPSVRLMQTVSKPLARLPNAVLYLIIALLMYRGHDQIDRAREGLSKHWSHYAAEDGMAALARQIEALDTQDTLNISGSLTNLDIPARIVWGAADRFLKLKYGKRLAQDLDAPLRRIDGAKHYVPEDHPIPVAQAVQELAFSVY